MNSVVKVQIDHFRGFPGRANGRLKNRPLLAGKRDDGAVMIRVAGSIEYYDALYTRDRTLKRFDRIAVAAFGEVRYALYQSGLSLLWLSNGAG